MFYDHTSRKIHSDYLQSYMTNLEVVMHRDILSIVNILAITLSKRYSGRCPSRPVGGLNFCILCRPHNISVGWVCPSVALRY